MHEQIQSARRSDADRVLADLADYVAGCEIRSRRAYEVATSCLIDALARGFLALRDPERCRHLGPVVPGATLAHGARVPGTSLELDPVMAAFNIGVLVVRSGAGAHPADSLGAILAVADYRSRQAHNEATTPLRVRDVLTAMIKAHEIQGVIGASTDFGRQGFDRIILVRIASAAVATRLLAGSREEILAAISNAWLDGASLRSVAQDDASGSGEIWAAADASSRGVRHSLLARAGEPCHLRVLSNPRWGFHEAPFAGRALLFERGSGSEYMANPSFTTGGPADFDAAVAGHFVAKQAGRILARFADPAALAAMPVNELLAVLVKNS